MVLWSFLHRLHVPVLRVSVGLMRVVIVKVHVLLLLHRKVAAFTHLHVARKMHVLTALHLNIAAAIRLMDVHHLSLLHVNVHCVLALEVVPLLRLLLSLVVRNELSILVLRVLLIHHRRHLRLRLLLLHHHLLLYHLRWEWHLNRVLQELTAVVIELLLRLLLVWHSLGHVVGLWLLLVHLRHHRLSDRSHVVHRVLNLMLLRHVLERLSSMRHVWHLLLRNLLLLIHSLVLRSLLLLLLMLNLLHLRLHHRFLHLARLGHHIVVKLLVELVHLIDVLRRHLLGKLRRSRFLLNLILVE